MDDLNSPVRFSQTAPGLFLLRFLFSRRLLCAAAYQISTVKTISSKTNKTRMSSKEVKYPIGIRPYPDGLQSSLHAMPGENKWHGH